MKKFPAYCVFLLICSLLLNIPAAGQSWRYAGGPVRASISHAIIDPSDPATLYAVGEGLYKGTDNGSHWMQLDPRPTQAVMVNPLNRFTILADHLKSTDGGATFTAMPIPAGVTALRYSPSDTNVVYAGLSHGSVYISVDGGTSWAAASSGIDTCTGYCPVRSIAISHDSTNIVLAGSIFKTADGGASWKPVFPFQTFAIVPDLSAPNTFFAGTDLGLYRSTDNGESWGLYSMSQMTIRSIAVNPVNHGTVLAGTSYAGLWRSTDGGLSWLEANTGIPKGTFWAAVTEIVYNPGDTTVVYCGTEAGFYKSTDGGISWSESDRGFSPDMVYDIAAPQSGTNYAIGTQGVFRQEADSLRWRYIGGMGGRAVAVDHGDEQRIIESFTTPAGDQPALTTDGGLTWAAGTWNGAVRITSIQFAPSNSRYVYASDDSSTGARSTDGGMTWNPIDFGRPIRTLAVNPESARVIIQGGPAGIFGSSDSGATWEALSFLNNGHGMKLTYSIHPPFQLFAAINDSGIFRSFDGGVTWENLHFPLTTVVFRSLRADISNGLIIAGTAANGVYASRDAGTTWAARDAGLPSNSVTATALIPPSGGLVSLSGRYGVYSFENLLTGVSEQDERAALPSDFQLEQNYPNPFNPSTEIRYRTSTTALVTLKIYNVLGQEIAVLRNGIESPGEKLVVWNAGLQPSGVYFCRLEVGGRMTVRKLLLAK